MKLTIALLALLFTLPSCTSTKLSPTQQAQVDAVTQTLSNAAMAIIQKEAAKQGVMPLPAK